MVDDEIANVLAGVRDDYKGMEGKLGDKEKAAVDGLIALLAEIHDYKLGTDAEGCTRDIAIVGKFTNCQNLDDPGAKPFGLWRVSEVGFGWKGGPGPATCGGSSTMRSEPAAVGMLAACEEYLEEFHTPPYRPDRWYTDIDEKADAEWRLRWLWRIEPKETTTDG